jgi:hypothetical protein
MEIRPMDRCEGREVARLRVRMLEELGGEDPGPLLDATGAFLDRRLDSGRHFTSVAEDEGRLVGIASLEGFESLPGVPPVGTTRLGRELSPGGLPEVQAHSHDFLVLAYVERSEASPCCERGSWPPEDRSMSASRRHVPLHQEADRTRYFWPSLLSKKCKT